MKFLDLFAGIGGFRLGLEQAGHQCVGYVEWDEFARKSYEAIYNTEGEWTWYDVTTIDYRDIPRSDCWTFGFPCQDISVAGEQKGFGGNRSSQFFAVTKRLRQIKEWDSEKMPSYLLIENVKNFLSVNRGWDFLEAQIELDEIGYNLEWDVLNSRDFGVPQNRERVFIVGHLRGRSTRKVFPVRGTSCEANSIDIIAHRKGYRRNTQVFNPTGITETLDTGQGGGRGHYTISKVENENHNEQGVFVKDIKCINPRKKDGSQTYQQDRVYETEGNMVALSSQLSGRFNIVDPIDKYRIRKLTPRECWRLQGFPDWAFDKAAEVNSDSQLYKQAGNSVTVNVIEAIGKKLY